MAAPPLKLGRIVGTHRTLGLDDKLRGGTHMHVIGSSGRGKSKFLESIICQDIANRRGICLIDPHGTLAQSVLAFVSRRIFPPKHFYYIQPSSDDWTCVYNPLNRKTHDPWFLINALKVAVLKCWGQDSSFDTPRLDEWLTTVLVTGVALKLTLPDLATLLEPTVERNVQRRAIIEQLSVGESRCRAAWEQLCYLAEKKPVEFEAMVGATTRRLSRFVDNPRLARMYGVPGVSLDLAAMMDEGAVILVDLSPAGRFYAEDAQLFGTLLLTDFYVQMFNRSNYNRRFTLYIDEFQNFVTKDISRILDESRKFGIEFCLAHQRPGQLTNSDSAEVRDIFSAVMNNAHNKVVFGGITPDELEPIARLLTINTLDPYKIKREISTVGVVGYAKEYWQAHGHSSSHSRSTSYGGSQGSGSASMSGQVASSGTTYDPNSGLVMGQRLFTSESNAWQSTYGTNEFSGSSWADGESDTESHSTTEFPVLVPIMGEQLSSVYYERPEEQLLQAMAIMHDQQQRHAMVKVLGQQEPVPIEIPFVRTPTASPAQLERQLALGYKAAWFLPTSDAERLVQQRALELRALGKTLPGQAPRDHATLKTSIPNAEPMPASETFAPIHRIGNVVLQERDFAILCDTFENRFISIRHAAELHWPGQATGDTAAKRRLAQLADEKVGLLQQQKVEVEGCRVIYRLTKKSVELLAERGLIPQIILTDWADKMRRRYTDEIATSHLAHELGLYDLKVAVMRAVARQPHLRVGEFGIWPLPYVFPVTRNGRSTQQKPDGFLRLDEHRLTDGSTPSSHFFYVEFDHGGNEKQDVLAEKADGYRAHLRNGGFAAQLGIGDDVSFRVLIVVATAGAEARRNNMCARLSALGIHTLVWITTMEEFLNDPLGPIWVTPKTFSDAPSGSLVKSPLIESFFAESGMP